MTAFRFLPSNRSLSCALLSGAAGAQEVTLTRMDCGSGANDPRRFTDSFAYTVSNGVTSSAAGVTVRLASTPDAPRAQDAVYEVAAGSVLYVNMADKVYDPPDPLVLPYDGTPQLEIATPPSLGTAEFTNRSYLTYTAPTDLGGATSTTFTYYGNDVWSHGNIATVTINFV